MPPAWRTTVTQIRPGYAVRRKGDVDFGQQGLPRDRRESRSAVGSKILMSQLPLETVHERDIEVRKYVHCFFPFFFFSFFLCTWIFINTTRLYWVQMSFFDSYSQLSFDLWSFFFFFLGIVRGDNRPCFQRVYCL